MPLIEEVKRVCRRLAPKGWEKLLKKHDLDITKPDLAVELARDLTIDRDVPGFEDFAGEGRRGIEPYSPARSLLYHALASPNVLVVDRAELRAWPTLEELEVVENYVYGVKPPSLQELSALAAGDLMAIVVFATEYRAAVDTVHRKHADVCFSRTGVARVGTAAALYDARSRGFTPFVQGDDYAFRVLPARYAAYVAVQRLGNETSFGPMRFNFRRKHPELFSGRAVGIGDEHRKFWVPLHKLFSGGECLRDHPPLRVSLEPHHVNEKIRRIHLELARRGHRTGWKHPDIDKPPFRFTDGIAAFSKAAGFGDGLLVPVVHRPMVKAVTYQGRPLTFEVPSIRDNEWAPSLEIAAARSGERAAPEYVHVRDAPTRRPSDLNDLPKVAAAVKAGGYRARHYMDFAGDGWIAPVCPELNAEFPRLIAAYSVVTAPDFFFNCDQRELMDWWLERAPTALRKFLWETPPLTLADERLAPNLQLNNLDFAPNDSTLPKAGFRPEDDTVCAIVSLPLRGEVQERPLTVPYRNRHSWLPDAAAGVFAPGWDTSFDRTGKVDHLAAYGLGSPFPEDSKLCAALSTYWPAVAPDAGRTFSQVFPTVCPLTDEELGQIGRLPWDGVRGPRRLEVDGAMVVEYADFEHVDYVENALKNKFTLKLTSRVDTRRYIARVLAMARAYRAVGVKTRTKKGDWNVLSFREVVATDPELKAAQRATGERLGGDVFRFELYKPAIAKKQPADFRKMYVEVASSTTLFVGGTPRILVKTGDSAWHPHHVDV